MLDVLADGGAAAEVGVDAGSGVRGAGGSLMAERGVDWREDERREVAIAVLREPPFFAGAMVAQSAPD